MIIARETQHLRQTGDAGKWVLDMTASALFSHLMEWGERHPLIEVVCDNSKPLRAAAGLFDAMINRPNRVQLRAFRDRQLRTWNMSRPVDFASSIVHPGVQVADLIAGVTAAMPWTEARPELAELSDKVFRHLSEDCIMLDLELAAGRSPRGHAGIVAIEYVLPDRVPQLRRRRPRPHLGLELPGDLLGIGNLV